VLAVIEEILPAGVEVVEAWHERPVAGLFAQERAIVAHAVEKRRREFAAARGCAHAALSRLGVAPAPILVGERGEPRWPAGVVGSITHCDGYRACAVARSRELVAIGIDAEPHAALPPGIESAIARPEEQRWLQELALLAPEVHWGRLLFSAKESTYKAWFPRAKGGLGFEDLVVTVEPDRSTFAAELLSGVTASHGPAAQVFCGRWLIRHGLVLTAVVEPR
jgi:4'-phosphopantetheinyl transferase EntD